MEKKAKLRITGDIPIAARQRLGSEISAIIPLEIEPVPSFRSALSDQPSFIQIIAYVAVWTPLTIAASNFLAQLAKRAADDAWDHKKEIAIKLKTNTVALLKKFTEALNKARQASNQNPYIIVGIPLPEDHFGTTFRFQAEDENDIAWFVANFLIKAEAIEKAIQEEMAGEHRPFASIQLHLQKDGSLIMQWMDRNELNEYKRRIE
ncbi:MAG: hypothetical protein ABII89_02260 [Candidatus Omnitrophota bacterium]